MLVCIWLIWRLEEKGGVRDVAAAAVEFSDKEYNIILHVCIQDPDNQSMRSFFCSLTVPLHI